MGASEGVYQPERGFKKDAGTFELVAGAKFHPFRLTTVLWERKLVNAVDIHLEMLDGDKVYTIDEYLACADKYYTWPNEDSPCPLTFVPAQRIRLRVTGAVDGEEQSAVITWAELGVV